MNVKQKIGFVNGIVIALILGIVIGFSLKKETETITVKELKQLNLRELDETKIETDETYVPETFMLLEKEYLMVGIENSSIENQIKIEMNEEIIDYLEELLRNIPSDNKYDSNRIEIEKAIKLHKSDIETLLEDQKELEEYTKMVKQIEELIAEIQSKTI